MRRALPALALTLVGLGALATFKTTPAGVRSAAARTTPTTIPAATAPPPSSSSSSSRSSSSSTTPTTSGAARVVDGDAFDNQYGTVQVRVTLQGTHIVSIEAVQLPYDRARSQYISEQAEPLLRQEALQAQSAQIDTVSGATYTSEGYIQSLQSALDRAHA